MKAILLETAGRIENLLFREIDKPTPTANEVLVEVKAIGINPVDYKTRANPKVLTMINGERRPVILGWDIAGTVVQSGNNVTKFQVGDRVFGMINFPGNGNAYAEFVAAPEAHLAKIPSNTSFEEAAATTLAALTAVQALNPNVKKGDRVLIQAGSGGVGHFAIPIAKSLGAYVIATSSAKNKNFVLSLGADEHIDYHTQNFENILTDIDFVLDMFNGDILLNSVKVAKEGASIISLPSSSFSEELLSQAKKRNINVSFLLVQSNGSDMNTLRRMLENKIIKPHISNIFLFDDMGKAHLQLESGRTVGKIVVKV